jgi:prepilin-type N-terminal cleavage/methylation domain-containing protein
MSNLNTFRARMRQRGGFTLLEIMLAVTILAVIITAVYNTWSAALTAWKRGTQITDTFQRQRIVLDTLSELTTSAVFYGAKPELYAVTGTHSDTAGDSVSFVTASDVLLPPGEGIAAGMRRVTLSLENDKDGNVFLGLVNAPALEDPDADTQNLIHVLSADVTGFTVRYLDPQNATWVDHWEEKTRTPSALEFTVTFRAGSAGTAPVTVTRQVDIPAALYAQEHGGQMPLLAVPGVPTTGQGGGAQGAVPIPGMNN